MSLHVTTQLKTRAEHTDEVINTLSSVLPESLQCEGREAIHIRQDQDDPAHIVSFTQWATRRNYEDYLAWRTETGFRDEPDVLRDEGEAYAAKLRLAGVPVTTVRYDGICHDFMMLNPLSQTNATRAAIAQENTFFRKAFDNR